MDAQKPFLNGSVPQSPKIENGRRIRPLYILGLFGALAFLLLYYYNRSGPGVDYKLYYTLLKSIPADDSCIIPNPDPWDPSIQKYLEKPDPLVCKKFQGELTYLDDHGWLHFNQSAMKEEGYSKLNCDYRCFGRGAKDDVTIVYKDWTRFGSKVQPGCEFVETTCSRTFPAISVYSNLHSQVLRNETRVNELKTVLNQRAKRPISVLLFVIDSVSRSNAIRMLPKMLNVLENDYQAVVLEGYNKVGDNSFPNAAAFLTGKRAGVAGYPAELKEDMTDSFFDDWPLVWKDFMSAGYLTFYGEDYPNYNLFTYLSNGFVHQPTDHYFRPYWVQLWGTFLHRRSTHLCFGNSPKLRLQLNYLRQFLEKYHNHPKFTFDWQTELGHDWLNQVNVGDEDLANYFQKIKPFMNDTILFIFSDHGHRFDAIRESVVGRLEDRMPFFSVALPPWMQRRFPQIQENLRNNSKLLTTPFDLYITLQDIIQSGKTWTNLGTQPDWSKLAPRGHSLFRPISPQRSCYQAGVPEEFCTCQQETFVNVSDPKVIRAAGALIQHVNKLLQKQYPKECARLVLKDIKNAQTFLPNLKMVFDPQVSIFYGGHNPTGFYVNYRVTIQTEPSDAILEGTLRNSVKDDSFVVIGDVNRINKYGNQSICIQSASLRKFCYCVI